MTPSCSRPVSSRPRWRAKSTRSRAAASTLLGAPRHLQRRSRSAPLRPAAARPARRRARFSSSRICMDSAGWVTAQASAARPKCRCSRQRGQITQLFQGDHADKIILSRRSGNTIRPYQNRRNLERLQTPRHSREPTEHDRRETWTQRLTTRARASARSRAAADTANRDWWPDALDIEMLHRNSNLSDPMGKDVRLRQGVQEPRPQRRDQGPACLDDGLAGVVAGRLRPLRRPDDPHGVAQRGHLPHHRRPRRRRRRPAALRAAQLAGRTTPTSTRRAGCCGRSSRSTAGKSPGPT